MANNDKDITIGFKTETDLQAAKATEQAVTDVGTSGERAMARITNEAARAEQAVKKVPGGATVGFGDNGRAASEARAAAAEAQRNSEAAIRAKENEAKATRTLTSEENTLAAAQKDRAGQAERDVEDAKAKRAAREQAGAEGAGADGAAIARGGAYAAAIFGSIKLANAATQELLVNFEKAGVDLDKLRATYPGEFLWIDMLQKVSNPLDTIKDFVSTGFANLAGLPELQRGAEQAADLAVALEKSKEAAKRYAEVDNRIRLANLGYELKAVNDITEALERQIRLERSGRKLEEARAQAADTEAVRGGADPNVVAAQAAARQAQAEVTALNKNFALVQRGISEASAKLEQADKELLRVNSIAGADSVASQDAYTAFLKARDTLDALTADAKVLEQELANEKGVIIIGVEEAFKTAGIDIQKQAAEKGQALVESITGAGSELTALQQDAKARADAILADGKIAAGETDAFQQAFLQLISGVRADTATYLEIAAEGNAIISTAAAATAALKQELTRLKAQVNQLSGR